MGKIYGLIEECRYGIHDLSRTKLDEINALPRFNMPIELGLFLGAMRYGRKESEIEAGADLRCREVSQLAFHFRLRRYGHPCSRW